MADAKHTEQFTLSGVRLFHPNLIVPRKFKDPRTGKESGDPKYSALFGIDPNRPDFAEMKRLATLVAKDAALKDEDGNLVPLNKLSWPFKTGDKLADKAKAEVEASKPKAKLADYSRGLVIVKTSSLFPVGLAYVNGKQIVELDFDDEALRKKNAGKFFFGAEVWADITFSPHQVGSNTPGVNAYLTSVMATGKGERIGGFTPASERFKSYLGHLSAADPTAGQEDVDEPSF